MSGVARAIELDEHGRMEFSQRTLAEAWGLTTVEVMKARAVAEPKRIERDRRRRVPFAGKELRKQRIEESAL